ncbi:MAG TPA: phosphoenolpyruvate--protein phosphotransferase [Thermoanaerobaculia bacterium]|nr:phosphoenolpyruvate--protein phosphotransferase [Thermoanaerobaculia bacterium]
MSEGPESSSLASPASEPGAPSHSAAASAAPIHPAVASAAAIHPAVAPAAAIQPPPAAEADSPAPAAAHGMRVFYGLGVSSGVAIGRAVVIETRLPDVFRVPLAEEQIEEEVARLRVAVEHARRDLEHTRDRVGEDLGSDLAAIFDAHMLLLKDAKFVGRVEERIRTQRINAEWAVRKTVEELDEHFARLDNAYLRERSADLTDVSRHLLRSLQGISHHKLAKLPKDVVIVADDLTPSDAIRMGRERVLGFAVESGGRTSHTTIIARSLNLPAVAGLTGVTQLVADQVPVIVDGEIGALIVEPTPEVLAQYRARRFDLQCRDQDLMKTRELAAATRDGVEIELMANIDLPEEVAEGACYGAAGIGLYRSEFLYIEKSPRLPTEDEQVALYRQLVEAVAPRPAIIRTYDLGGRKLAREVMETHEDNPVLGLRGIRLTLARPDIFRIQVRALLRAGLFGNLWVMLPLVSSLEELRRFRALAGEVSTEMEREGVPFRRDLRLGVMIEVPAAAMIADILAREVDFFSIGTNDLIQYSLAVDRNNEHVADLYQPLHPAMLRMLRFVIDSARGAHVDVGMCGEMAGDPRCAVLLVGMGMRRLSMSPRRIPEVKTLIRRMSAGRLAELADACMRLHTAAEVQQELEVFLDAAIAPGGAG